MCKTLCKKIKKFILQENVWKEESIEYTEDTTDDKKEKDNEKNNKKTPKSWKEWVSFKFIPFLL